MSAGTPTRLIVFTGCWIVMSAHAAPARPAAASPGPGVESSAAASLAAEETAAAAAPANAAGATSALCGGLWLSGGELRDAASGAVLWSDAAGASTSLACGEDENGRIAAVGGVRGARGDGRIVLLEPGPVINGPWAVRGEIATRGVPRMLRIERGRIAMVLGGRKEYALGIADAKPGAKVQSIVLAQTPTGLAVSPDGDSFMVAVGTDLRSYRIDDGRTRTIIPFPEPILAVAARRGVGRILVGQGSGVVAVDPRDKADRGLLPVRARADLPGPAADLEWLDGGRAVAVLVREPSSVLLLAGADLSVLGRLDRDADAIDPEGARAVRWARSGAGGENASDVLSSSSEPPPLPEYVPAPTPAPAPEAAAAPAPAPAPRAAEPSPPSAEPLRQQQEAERRAREAAERRRIQMEEEAKAAAAKAAAARAAPPNVEPPAEKNVEPPPVKAKPPAEKPIDLPPANAGVAPPKIEPAPAQTQPPPSVAPGGAPPRVDAPPAKTEPPPSAAPGSAPPKIEPPPAKTEATPAPPRVEPPPAKLEPAPPPALEPPPLKTEPAPGAVLPPTEAPAAATVPPAATAPAAHGGSIAGTITGRVDLVAEVVVLGPDSLMKQFARVKVVSTGGASTPPGAGSASFDLGSVPPGRYVVTPMGAHGASLSARPSAARVIVTAEAGARADFEILGAL